MWPINKKVARRRYFPDPKKETLDGIVAMGDDINVDILHEAYSFGIFPWPHPEMPCLWFSPDERGVLEFKDLRINRSLAKFLKKNPYRITFDQAFEKVMRECSFAPRPGQDGTWITEPLLKAYLDFHKAGFAHSIEAWDGDELVGGLYGVFVGKVFSGESMFYKKTNASKVCLLAVIEMLKSMGLIWMDIQMITPVTESLGGKYVSKDEYLKKIT